MLSHGVGSLFVATGFEQIEQVQVLLAVFLVALAVLHGTVRHQATHPVHTSNGVDEKRVARGLDQRFMKTHATFVQLIGRIGFNAAIEQMVFRSTAFFDDFGV